MKENTKLNRSWGSAWNSYARSRGKGFVKRGFWKLLAVILCGVFLIFNPDILLRPSKSSSHHDKLPNLNTHTFTSPALHDSQPTEVHARQLEQEVVKEPQSIPAEDSEADKDEYDPQLWRHLHSYSFEPRVAEWNEKRAKWRAEHPFLRSGKKNVLLVTGSQPKPCERAIGNHLLVKAAKNKIDYCRLHDIPLYYNMAHPEPELAGWWVKLSVIRMLMLAHPEVEWIWWVDSDAVFTDMVFEPPFYNYGEYNLVLYGDEHMVYDLKDWKGVNTGDFFMRNCQWSLDLLDAWASMGPTILNKEAGTLLSKFLYDRGDWGADDQSAIVYLLVTERKRWASKVHFEGSAGSFVISGDWTLFGPRFEELMANFQPGSGDSRCPLITHFAGCQPCSRWNQSNWDECLKHMRRSFDFADHQVYQPYGFNISELGSSQLDLLQAQTSTPRLHIGDWDKKRRQWLDDNPEARRPGVFLVSRSPAQPCSGGPVASFLLLRATKNKIDYSRLHDIPFFHNSLDLDQDLIGSGWDKIPVLKTLMLSHPEVEWVWWVDTDAIFIDMNFELQLGKFEGRNLVLWGDEKLVLEGQSSRALNTGAFLLRNCQWSLDLLDAWAAMGSLEVRAREAKDILNKAFTHRQEDLEADDQSALVYGLVAQKKKWFSRVFFESSQVFPSGNWTSLLGSLDEMALSTSGSDRPAPFITHFSGCQLCQESGSNVNDRKFKDPEFAQEVCVKQMERAFDFADNHVLRLYGLQHRHLGSSEVLKVAQ